MLGVILGSCRRKGVRIGDFDTNGGWDFCGMIEFLGQLEKNFVVLFYLLGAICRINYVRVLLQRGGDAR